MTLTNNTTKEIKMAYPYIGKNSSLCGDFSIAIFYGEKHGALLENTIDDIPLHKHLNSFNESEFENITADYLRNTKVKIESEEHAEFVIKLFNNAFGTEASSMNPRWIYNEGLIGITQRFHGEPSEELKLITIPLPPKEENMKNSAFVKFMKDGDMTHMAEVKECGEIQITNNSTSAIVKYNQNSDSYSIEDSPKESEEWQTKEAGETVKFKTAGRIGSKSEEWPAISDCVAYKNQKWKVGAIYKHMLLLACENDTLFALVGKNEVKKPPTPEEELAANIANAADSDDIHSTHVMIAKAIINGEIKGLSYKPE